MSDEDSTINYERDRALEELEEDRLDQLQPEKQLDPLLPPTGSRAFGQKLALVIGHTEARQGATATTPISMLEYTWNLQLAKLVESKGNAENIQCGLFFRDGIGIKGAYAQVLDWNPDAVIELHFNAFNQSVTGTETLCGPGEASKAWARVVHGKMINAFNRSGRSDRGVRILNEGDRGYRSVSSLTTIPSCLVEPFFADAPSDAQLGKDRFDYYATALLDAQKQFALDVTFA